jgi:hypothetical protein
MTVSYGGKIVFAFPLLFVLAFASVPAHAQSKPPGAGVTTQELYQALTALTARVTTLETKVSKLEGNITCDDLAGTYHYAGFQVELSAPGQVFVSSYTQSGTISIAADGTITGSVAEDGSTLHQGSPWFLTPFTSSGAVTIASTCDSTQLSNGFFTVNSPQYGPITVYVAAGARMLVITGGGHAPNLVILTRLK